MVVDSDEWRDPKDWRKLDRPLRLNYSVKGIHTGNLYLNEKIEVCEVSVTDFKEDVENYEGSFVLAKICGFGGFILPKRTFEGENIKYNYQGKSYSVKHLNES